MRGKGRFFSELEISRIISLLSGTDMTIAEIAGRMRCSVSAIGSINRRNSVRNYAGARSTWGISMGKPDQRHGSA